MTVFITAEKTELNQISLTGMRALVLLGLLLESPKSLEEIREAFISMNIMERNNSDDMIRIDLNTLRTMGCDITRSCLKTEYKYKLLKHPFALTISQEEVSVLKKVYKKIKENADLSLILSYDNLFKKIAEFVTDEKIKEALYGIPALKEYEPNYIEELLEDCGQGRVITLEYKNPMSKESSIKNIAAQKLVFQNDKVYLYGYDTDKKDSIVLNIKRILRILSKADNKSFEPKTTKVRFFLTGFGIETVREDETIIEKKENGCLVEGNYHNEFVAFQRIMSFGSKCTVIEPEDFREMIIQNLKEMRENYDR